ncbi:MAG: SDR family oxidoreductase [Oligoflexia bacterium]|nr:SDR family oxidoreductase [Oligoflexia bacterium]
MNEKPAVLVTGAGTGIGASVAQIFSDNGYEVILTGRRLEYLEKVAAKLKTKNHVIQSDLTDEKSIKDLISACIKKTPHIGILINNAGTFHRGDFLQSTDLVWQEMFDIHVMAPVRLSRLLIPQFKKNKSGVIINVASTAGLRPISGLIAYTTLKAAQISFTQTLALEHATDNIRVNVVCPGIVDTPIHKIENLNESEQAKIRQDWAQAHPLKKVGQAIDVANAIYNLSIPSAGWITGVVLPVDGGISLT